MSPVYREACMFHPLENGWFKCTNQSQFRDAIKSLGKDRGDNPLDMYRYALDNGLVTYPKKYPCLVKFTFHYHGFWFPKPTIYVYGELEKHIAFLQKMLDEQF